MDSPVNDHLPARTPCGNIHKMIMSLIALGGMMVTELMSNNLKDFQIIALKTGE